MASSIPHGNDLYVTIDGVTLTHGVFNSMLDFFGPAAWMKDDMLDTSAQALRIRENCDAHSIGFVNTVTASMCVMAANSDGPEAWYAEYRSALHDKRWIVVPTNDGMSGEYQSGSAGHGTHWSLVVVDRVRGEAFFYDSFSVSEGTRSYEAAHKVSTGLQLILGDGEYLWWPQMHCPNQERDNNFSSWVPSGRGSMEFRCRDRGPCGPFVWKMSQYLIQCIKAHQAVGQEDECQLDLPADFRRCPFTIRFNSYLIRGEMMVLIAGFKSEEDARNLEERFMQHYQAWFPRLCQVRAASEEVKVGRRNSFLQMDDVDDSDFDMHEDTDVDESADTDENADLHEAAGGNEVDGAGEDD